MGQQRDEVGFHLENHAFDFDKLVVEAAADELIPFRVRRFRQPAIADARH